MRETINFEQSGCHAKLLDRLAALLKLLGPTRAIALLEQLTMQDERTMTEVLRDAIQKSGLSFYALGKSSGVGKAQIARFLNGERDLRLASAEKLASTLGLFLGARNQSGVKAGSPG